MDSLQMSREEEDRLVLLSEEWEARTALLAREIYEQVVVSALLDFFKRPHVFWKEALRRG